MYTNGNSMGAASGSPACPVSPVGDAQQSVSPRLDPHGLRVAVWR